MAHDQDHARQLALHATHYENFPVASWLLPRHLRRPVALVYAFAREADDFADEGDFPPEERLARLDAFRRELDRIASGETPETALFRDLATLCKDYGVPLRPFYDLLSAFSQDVVKTRYATFAEVLDYCKRSANPVGEILLYLFGEASELNLARSNAICTSLQLINFLQDIAVDWQKGRVYLPQDELAKYGITERQIALGQTLGMWRPFMGHQIERTWKLLRSGAPLGKSLPGRIGLEIRAIVAGGDAILRKLHKSGGDVFSERPVLKAGDWPIILWRAVRAR